MIKNRAIFLVQLATRPFPKHIYRSLRALLNSTLTRNEFGVSKPKPYAKERVPNYVSKLSRPKLDFHTHTHSFHTNIHSFIPVSLLLSSFPYFFFSFLFFLSLLFSLIRFCSLFLQDQNEIFIFVLSLFDLIPFLFHFFSLLEHP